MIAAHPFRRFQAPVPAQASESHSSAARWTLLLFLVASGGACTHVPARPPRTRGPQACERTDLRPRFLSWDFRAEPLDSGAGWRSEQVRFLTHDDIFGDYQRIEGEVFLPATGSEPFPLLEVSPILGGAMTGFAEARYFCSRMARAGYASYFLYQGERLLDPLLDGVELARHLRSMTRSNIKALDLVILNYPIDVRRVGSFGISFGALRNVLLAAAEPRLRANVFVLVGGNLPAILESSSEPEVRDYIADRSLRTGEDREAIVEDLARQLAGLDPLDTAPLLDPLRTLVLLARWDPVVRPERGEELLAALGFPEVWWLPAGHYTAIIFFPWALGVSREFFDRELRRG